MEYAALSRLDALWDALTQVSVKEDEDDVVISVPFLHFSAGTGITTVWAWFETMNPAFTVAHKLYGSPPPCRSNPCPH
ncbi:hypothetical protein SAMN04487787_101604 [Kosakonia sacchari]|nr:hypothetical protein SAMN04487787_101604 [Kosakonia sacchari]